MFHSARFDARTDERGDIILLPAQDRAKWNTQLIGRAMHYLTLAEPDINTSTYHIEATIQSVHTMSPSFEQTDWAVILGLYKRLYKIKPNPIVALHTSVSIGQVHGPEAEIEHLQGLPLADYYLYHAILGDAFSKSGRPADAAASFARAIELTMNSRERALLEERLAGLRIK
jgi:RNA polymerase sigma-70 factor (ECF subfamily)